MARGNQREVAREKNLKKLSQAKKQDDGLTPEQRHERDAKVLQEKAARKAAQSASGGGDAGETSTKK